MQAQQAPERIVGDRHFPPLPKPGAAPVRARRVPACPPESTRYLTLYSASNVASFPEPWGPGYSVVLDQEVDTRCYSEIRVWVHLFAETYQEHPFTPAAGVTVRFMHQFPGGSFDYEKGEIHYTTTSYLNGYVARPIIGDRLRLLISPTPFALPSGPFSVSVTAYLVR